MCRWKQKIQCLWSCSLLYIFQISFLLTGTEISPCSASPGPVYSQPGRRADHVTSQSVLIQLQVCCWSSINTHGVLSVACLGREDSLVAGPFVPSSCPPMRLFLKAIYKPQAPRRPGVRFLGSRSMESCRIEGGMGRDALLFIPPVDSRPFLFSPPLTAGLNLLVFLDLSDLDLSRKKEKYRKHTDVVGRSHSYSKLLLRKVEIFYTEMNINFIVL